MYFLKVFQKFKKKKMMVGKKQEHSAFESRNRIFSSRANNQGRFIEKVRTAHKRITSFMVSFNIVKYMIKTGYIDLY